MRDRTVSSAGPMEAHRPDFKGLVRARLTASDLSGERQGELVEELAAQIEDRFDELVDDGVVPDQAWQEVRREFLMDPVANLLELPAGPPRFSTGQSLAPDRRLYHLRHQLGRAVRRGIRYLGGRRGHRSQRDRTFRFAVVVTLAVAVGTNGAVFTIVNSVLWAPLPFAEADRVMLMANQSGSGGNAIRTTVPSYFDRLKLDAFDEVAMFRWIDMAIDAGSGPQRVRGTIGTPSLLRLTGVPPVHGRVFNDAEGVAGEEQKIILSYGLWQELFDGDRSAVGTSIRVAGGPFEIVGIMPEGFGIFRLDARFWVPAVYTEAQRADSRRSSNDQYQIGRLKPGVTASEARAQLDALNAANLERFPELVESRERIGFYVSVDPLRTVITREVAPMLYLLFGGAVLVMLIALANLVNLSLARSEGLRKDLGTRVALGAGPRGLMQPFLKEGLWLGTLAGVLGVLAAVALIRFLRYSSLDLIPRAGTIQVDLKVVLISLGVSMIGAVAIALVPVLQVYSGRSGARNPGHIEAGGLRVLQIRRGLVVAQVGLAFVLLTGGALLLASFGYLLQVDPGFEPDDLLTVRYDLPESGYPDPSSASEFSETVVARTRALPGVVEAAVTTLLPFGGRQTALTAWPESTTGMVIEGHGSSWYYTVSDGYFETMGIPLIGGRLFDVDDMAPSGGGRDEAGVVIVDEALAERLWPGRDAVGQRMFFGPGPDQPMTPPRTVVGVVGVIRQEDLRGAGAAGAAYVPHPTDQERSYAIVVRSPGDPDRMASAIRRVSAQMDPDIPLYDIATMATRMESSLASRQLGLALAVQFGLTATALAILGVYGVLGYLVALRRREFGIRMALGSASRDLILLVFGEGVRLVVTGLGLGLVAAYLLRGWLAGQLYGVAESGPLVVVAVFALIALAALSAALPPAIRAIRINPVTVLGEE